MKLLLLTYFLLMQLALAGKETGNGGVSVVCRDSKGIINSVELLDLYEGKLLYGRTYSSDLISVDQHIQLAQLRVISFPHFLNSLKDEVAFIQANMVFIPKGTELIPTNDAFPIIQKKGCQLEQLANYADSGEIFVSQEIYDELTNLNKASLLLHEAIYALRRKTGDTTSQQSRRLVSHLVATNGDQSVIDAIVGNETRMPVLGTYKLNKPGYACVVNIVKEEKNEVLLRVTRQGPTQCSEEGQSFKIEWIEKDLYYVKGIKSNKVYYIKFKKKSLFLGSTVESVEKENTYEYILQI